jgi:hypothetical protein
LKRCTGLRLSVGEHEDQRDVSTDILKKKLKKNKKMRRESKLFGGQDPSLEHL